MAAPQRVSHQQIVNAMLEWRGNVTAAAASLGIAANSLNDRLRRLGLRAEQFRHLDPGKPVTPITGLTGFTGLPATERVARKRDGAIFPGRGRAPNVSDMQTETAERELPIRAAPKRHTPLRMKDVQRAALEQAVFQLQALYQVATDSNLVLEQFIDECFPGWLREKLAAAEKPKRKGGAE